MAAGAGWILGHELREPFTGDRDARPCELRTRQRIVDRHLLRPQHAESEGYNTPRNSFAWYSISAYLRKYYQEKLSVETSTLDSPLCYVPDVPSGNVNSTEQAVTERMDAILNTNQESEEIRHNSTRKT